MLTYEWLPVWILSCKGVLQLSSTAYEIEYLMGTQAFSTGVAISSAQFPSPTGDKTGKTFVAEFGAPGDFFAAGYGLEAACET